MSLVEDEGDVSEAQDDFPPSLLPSDLEDEDLASRVGLELYQEVPLAVAESCGDLGGSTRGPTPSSSSTPLSRSRSRPSQLLRNDGIPRTPPPGAICASPQPASDNEDSSQCEEEFPKFSIPFRLVAVAVIIIIIGFLFLLVALVLSAQPLDDNPSYVIVGAVFLTVGIVLIAINIAYCRYREKSFYKKNPTPTKQSIYKCAEDENTL